MPRATPSRRRLCPPQTRGREPSGGRTGPGCVSTPYEDLVRWEFGEFVFRSGFDNVSSTIKLRQAGFADCLDTEQRFLELFDQLAAHRVIPPLR